MIDAGAVVSILAILLTLFVGIAGILFISVWLLWYVFGPPDEM